MKKCTKCNQEKDLNSFGKSKRTKDAKQTQCKDCLKKQSLENAKNRPTHEKQKDGIKKCSKCNTEKHVDEFYLNKNLSMGVHSECIKCTKEKVSQWVKDNPDKIKIQPCRKYKPKPKKIIIKEVELERKCNTCKIDKKLEDFTKNARRCKKCLKEYTQARKCTVTLTEKVCGKCKIVKPKQEYNIDNNTVSGLCSKCADCRKVEYENRKVYILQKKKEVHNYKYNNDDFYRLVYTIRGRIRNSLSIYLKDGEKKSRHSEEILGCTWLDFKKYIESQFLPWMSWDNFGDFCGDSPDYDCSWDLDHIIPVNWAKTNDELYSLNHWSNFQPLCSKVNRWEKKGNITPLCNIELNITVYI